jgi:hypothetical protein
MQVIGVSPSHAEIIRTPQHEAHANAEFEQVHIRQQFAKAITDRSLKIVINQPDAEADQPPNVQR